MSSGTSSKQRRAFGRRQLGFTLLELMVSVGIMGSLGGVIATSSFAMLKAQTDTNAHAEVAIEVSKSTRWLVRDIHRAASSDLVDGASPVSSADFTWNVSGTITTCNYSLNSLDNSLERTCSGFTSKAATGISSLQFSRAGDLISVNYTVTADIDPSRDESVELLVLLGGG